MTQGFLRDTNVLSEWMRTAPANEVLAWFASHAPDAMYTSSITQAEILTGIALLPEGKRRNTLAQTAQAMFTQDFAGNRVLSFDRAAAKHCALVVASRTRLGRPISTEDAQIAAIALASGLLLLTRNTKDFSDIPGLHQVNPWQSH